MQCNEQSVQELTTEIQSAPCDGNLVARARPTVLCDRATETIGAVTCTAAKVFFACLDKCTWIQNRMALGKCCI